MLLMTTEAFFRHQLLMARHEAAMDKEVWRESVKKTGAKSGCEGVPLFYRGRKKNGKEKGV
jgi:hypothetical protein